jgi:hypothetical protein
MRRPRPLLGALLIALLFGGTVACDGGSEPPQPPPTPKLPAGVIAAIGVDAPDRITVSDPQTGKVIRTVKLPDGAILFDRRNFSADWSMVAWLSENDGSLNAGELRGDGYVRSATWRATATDRYSSPAFHPATGRIWATLSGDGENAADETRIVSVNPRKPSDAPHPEAGKGLINFDSKGNPASAATAAVVGQTAAKAELLWTDQELVYADVRADDESARISYRCVERISGTAMACVGAGRYGSVARLTLDRAARTVTMQELLPASETRVYGVVAAPDGSRLMVNTDQGWTTIDATSGAASGVTRPELPADVRADLFDWI